ncbi:Clathrin interactor 1 [Geodia barretti]|uniref:Clathrin interactor 1 n=1 Tax=Geodia barretti TaxID=519541 RepID=A0AA35W9K9_GEOBA|nr:Clathrin interactor 1 [Geodia barretti]
MNRLVDRMTNMVMNYSDVESKVREATNDETWGPHGTLMADIAKYTFTYEHYPEVMTMLWKRMFEARRNWRRTYKALLLLHYLVRNGSERVVASAREHIYDMKPLEEYVFRDEQGKDQGVNVRQKAKEIISFIQDDERLKDARKQAKQSRDKFVGYSSEETQYKYSDRYAPEPRSRSSVNSSGGSKYDPDPHGPLDDNHQEVVGPETEDLTATSTEGGRHQNSSITSSKTDTAPQPAPLKKSSQPTKLVDLGAAAAFASQAAAENQRRETANSTIDSVFGDFSSQPPALQSQPPGPGSGGSGFADFEGAFGSGKSSEPATVGGGGDFGGFSAFQNAPQPPPQAVPPTASAAQTLDFGDFQGIPPPQPMFLMGGSGGILQPMGTAPPMNPQSNSEEMPDLMPTEEVNFHRSGA